MSISFNPLLDVLKLLKALYCQVYVGFHMTGSEIFLCLNGYSLKLAEYYLETRKNSLSQKCIIFYDPLRCTPSNLAHIRYLSFANVYSRLYFLALCITRRKDFFYFPHTSGGRLQKLAFRFAKKAYFIEDGLDTYRNTPLNIDLSLILNRPNYLCLHALASFRAPWVQQCNLIEINSSLDILLPPKQIRSSGSDAPVHLRDVERHLANTIHPTNVLIESRGISEFANLKCIDVDFCIPHPNKFKSLANLCPNLNLVYCNSDASMRFLQNPLHNVNFYVGETLLLFYLLKFIESNQSLHVFVCMSRSSIDNYSSLLQFIESTENVTFAPTTKM